MPFPVDYLRGIDLQRRDFEQKFEGYLGGTWKKGGWWYYYLYGLGVKTPIGTLLLLVLAILVSLIRCVAPELPRQHSGSVADSEISCPRWLHEFVLLAPSIVILVLVSSQSGINMFLRYVLPAVPCLFEVVLR